MVDATNPCIAGLCLAWTLGAYAIAKRVHRRLGRVWLSPAIVVPAVAVALMLALHMRARQRGQEEGVVASLTMVLAGVTMVLAGPTLIAFVAGTLGA